MARLPPECAGFRKVKPPAYFVRNSYNPDATYYRNGKVVIRCNWRSCAIFRVRRGTRDDYGSGTHASAGSLPHACAAVENPHSFAGLRRRRK